MVLSKLIKNQANSAFDGLINEHERDYRAVRLEWVSIPESSQLLCSAMSLSKSILQTIVINEDRIAANLGKADYLESPAEFMLGLAEKAGRQKTYKLLHDIIMRAYAANRPLKEVLEENPDITAQLNPQELSELLTPENHIGLAPKITELAITAAEEWLATHPPGNLSEYICPLADKNGKCTITFED